MQSTPDLLRRTCAINLRQPIFHLTLWRHIAGWIRFLWSLSPDKFRSLLRSYSFSHLIWHVDSPGVCQCVRPSIIVKQSIHQLVSTNTSACEVAIQVLFQIVLSRIAVRRKQSRGMCEINDLDECYNIAEELVLHAGKVRVVTWRKRI